MIGLWRMGDSGHRRSASGTRRLLQSSTLSLHSDAAPALVEGVVRADRSAAGVGAKPSIWDLRSWEKSWGLSEIRKPPRVGGWVLGGQTVPRLEP